MTTRPFVRGRSRRLAVPRRPVRIRRVDTLLPLTLTVAPLSTLPRVLVTLTSSVSRWPWSRVPLTRTRSADARLDFTVILTALLVVLAPALSVAIAVKTWLPVGTFLHLKEYGVVVSRPSTFEPSRNSTLATLPPGSLAAAVIVIVGFQAKTAPSAGEVMLTVGGVFPALTVIVAAALVPPAPRLSVARAVIVYVPAATPLQVKPYGAVVSSPSFVAPLKNSTLDEAQRPDHVDHGRGRPW